MRVIFPWIYSLFQKKAYTKNNSWLWKSADTARTSLNFEKKSPEY